MNPRLLREFQTPTTVFLLLRSFLHRENDLNAERVRLPPVGNAYMLTKATHKCS